MSDFVQAFWLAFCALFALLLLLWSALGLPAVLVLAAVAELVLQRMETRRIGMSADLTDRAPRG